MKDLETKHIQLDSINVAYTEYGEGEPLLLLHGNSESKKLFRKYQKSFFADYHTYALDSRGHGESRSEDAELSIEQISRDVLAFCKAMNIAKANVIGYSDGGNVALFLALRAPGGTTAYEPVY